MFFACPVRGEKNDIKKYNKRCCAYYTIGVCPKSSGQNERPRRRRGRFCDCGHRYQKEQSVKGRKDRHIAAIRLRADSNPLRGLGASRRRRGRLEIGIASTKKSTPHRGALLGAGDRTRTGTRLPARDFKSLVSTIPPHRRARILYHSREKVSRKKGAALPLPCAAWISLQRPRRLP